MLNIDSINVIPAAHDSDRLWGFSIDAPHSGSGLFPAVTDVVGWVLGHSSPAVKVTVQYEGRVLGQDQVHRHRPDVAAAYPHVHAGLRSGFRVTVHTAFPPRAELEVHAVLADGDEVPLARIIVERRRDPRRYLVECVRNTLSSDQLSRRRQTLVHPVRLGTLRRTSPISHIWGFDRGTPIDRYYIERFLNEHRADIHGQVLEVKDALYTERYGSGVDAYDVVDIDATNPHVTVIADLATATTIPSGHYDCFIMTQTLQVIYDFRSAVREAHRILRPGGVLLLTVPSLSKLAQYPSDYWRFTPAACSMLFESVFGPGRVDVQSYGNVLTGIGALAGLAREELSPEELDTHDEMFPVLVAVRAVKAVRPALVTSGGVDSADLPPKLGSVLQRSEPEGENRGIKPESVPQEPERLATVMRGLISPGARVLVIGDRGDTARAMPETGYRLSGGTADSAAPREDQTVLKHVTLEAIDSGHLMGKLESERFDVAFVLNFPHRFDDARSLVEMLRTLLLPEGYLVVLAPVAGASAPTEQWTHRKLHELLQDAAWATAKLEQRWIEFTGETPNKVSQSVSLSAEVLFAVAYPFSDRELRSMLRGFRHLAAGREAEQNNVAAQLARRDAELDTLQAELKSRKAELEIVYGSKTWRLATLYWKARQKVR